MAVGADAADAVITQTENRLILKDVHEPGWIKSALPTSNFQSVNTSSPFSPVPPIPLEVHISPQILLKEGVYWAISAPPVGVWSEAQAANAVEIQNFAFAPPEKMHLCGR